jgi:hypothetical protein
MEATAWHETPRRGHIFPRPGRRSAEDKPDLAKKPNSKRGSFPALCSEYTQFY